MSRDRGFMITPSHVSPEQLETAIDVLGAVPPGTFVIIAAESDCAVGEILRLDREQLRGPDRGADLCHAIADHLAESGVRVVTLALFCAEMPRGAPEMDDAVTALSERFEVEGAWLVAGGRFRAHGCDAPCCPPAGRLLRRPAPPSWHAAEPWSNPLAGEARAPERVVRSVARAAREVLSRRAHEGWARERLAAWRRLVERAMDGSLPTDAEAADALAALSDIRVRDAIIVDLHGSYAEVADKVAIGIEDPGVGAALADLFGQEGEEADGARLEAAALVAASVASRAPLTQGSVGAAHALTVQALAQWWRGERLSAYTAVDAALSVDPSYSLATLLASAIIEGLGPR